MSCNYNKEYEIKVIKNIEEIESIRPIWEKMQWHPNTDIDFYLTILKSRPEILCPYIIVFYWKNHPKAIVVGRIEEINFKISIGYKTLLSPRVRSLTILYGGLLGDFSHTVNEIFVSELWKSLKNGETDIVCLSFIKENSNIHELVKTKISFCFRDYITSINSHWKITLPEPIDEYYKKLKKIHRKSRTPDKVYPEENISFSCFKNGEQLDSVIQDAEKITQKTYLRGLKVGFINNFENCQRLKLWADKNALRSYFLSIENKKCAFWIGTIYKNTFHLNFTGYDPEYKMVSPSKYLLIKLILDLYYHNNIREIDFGFGDASYKFIFGTHNLNEVNINIYSPTFRGIYLNLIGALFDILSKYAKRILKRINLIDKIKKTWRKKLTKSN